MAGSKHYHPNVPGAMHACIEDYLEHLTVRHFAAQTVAYKRMALSRFTDWLHERGVRSLTDVTRPMLQRYQRHLYYERPRGGRALSAAAQSLRLVAVKGLFQYLTRNNLILYNPASELELPQPAKTLPKDVLTANEAERILSQPDIDTSLGVRDRAILETLYSTGIRRMELVNLTQPDLNLAQGVLAVRRGKGRQDRFVPIGERAVQWVDKYLSEVRPDLETADPRTVFLDPTGRQLDPHQLSRLVHKYIKQSGVNKRGRCHLFRHTAATLMLENGADIRYIQEMLGHAKLTTTEIYTRVSVHKLKAVHAATHPAKDRPTAGEPGTDTDAPTVDDVLAELAREADEEI